MPLPKLRGLTTVVREDVVKPRLRDNAVRQQANDTKQIIVVPPNASEGEQIVWDYIQTRSEYWVQQQTFGNIRERGSTRVDFLNPMLRVALYPQGAYIHRFRSAWDEAKYSIVRRQGYRVVEWIYFSNEHLKRNIRAWYNRDIG